MAEVIRKPRKPRRNFAAERERLVQTCIIRLDVLKQMIESVNFSNELRPNFEGQQLAYRDVLRMLGETQ